MKKHNRKQTPYRSFIPHPHPGATPRRNWSRSKYDPAKEDEKHFEQDLADCDRAVNLIRPPFNV